MVPAADPFATNSGHTTAKCDLDTNCVTADTVASGTVVLSDFMASTATLLNVCSYESASPTSNPEECVITPNNGFLTIRKVDTAVGDTTAFTFSLGSGQTSQNGTSSWTINGTGSQSLISFAPGTTYDLTEAIPAGWKLTNVSCAIQGSSTGTAATTPVLGSATAGVENFAIQSNRETICTFTNARQEGTIVVKKETTPDGSSQSFEFDPSYNAQNFFLTDGGQQSTGSLTPGNYSVAEVNIPADWDLTSSPCVSSIGDTETTGSIELDDSETVTCTFNNRQRGSITVVKNTTGGDGTFGYTGTLGLTTLTTATGTISQTFSNLTPGPYTLAEDDPAPAFDFSNLECTDPDSGSIVTLATRSAAIDLDAGESITCTYTNTKRGSVTVVKNTTGGDGTFGYTGTLGLTTLTTATGTISQTFSNLTPGPYTLAEDDPAPAFDFSNLECTDPDSGSIVTLATRSAAIDLDAGESITCTYTNTKRGSVTVVKNTTGGDGTFGYTGTLGLTTLTTATGTISQTFSNLTPGPYTLAENDPAPAFDFSNLECTDPDSGSIVTLATRSAAIDLDAGESITCTYTNTKRGSVTVVKNTTGGDGTFGYTGTLGLTTLTTATGTISQTFSNLTPGPYTLAENDPAPAFDFSNLECTDPDSGSMRDLGYAVGGDRFGCRRIDHLHLHQHQTRHDRHPEVFGRHCRHVQFHRKWAWTVDPDHPSYLDKRGWSWNAGRG